MGVSLPLHYLADFSYQKGPESIQRDNQVRTITVSSDLFDRDLGSVTEDIEAKLAAYPWPTGYSYDVGGQSEELAESFESLVLALIIAILLVYMVMAAQFESLLNPFLIIFSVPLAVSGGAIALFLTGRYISLPALIGVIMLAGIVVNNGIVLVDYANTLRREEGLTVLEAIKEAGPTRLRPILMTTFTTVLGLFPLALGIGEGTEASAPLATVVIGGLLLSTLLTLVYTPVLYTIFNRERSS
jgi:HAE1 family hydrophobic/amphiphilic exporter-1